MRSSSSKTVGFVLRTDRSWFDKVRTAATTLGFRANMSRDSEWTFKRGSLFVYFCLTTLTLRTLENGRNELACEHVNEYLRTYEKFSRHVKCSIVFDRLKLYLEDTIRIQKADVIDGAGLDSKIGPPKRRNGRQKRTVGNSTELPKSEEGDVTVTLTAKQLKLTLAGVKIYMQALSSLPEVSIYHQLRELEKILS